MCLLQRLLRVLEFDVCTIDSDLILDLTINFVLTIPQFLMNEIFRENVEDSVSDIGGDFVARFL